MYLPRIRRINDAVNEIRKLDPKTEITRKLILELIKYHKLTYMKYGNAWIVNLDELYGYLKGKEFEHENSKDFRRHL